MGVVLRLDLDYRLKPGELVRFLEATELAAAAERERAAPGSGLASLEQALLAPRVSSYLLRAVMDLRYAAVDGGRPTMPRSAGIGRWWGRFEAMLDDRPAGIEMQRQEVRWLLEAWRDLRVQDGFPRDHQRWLNVLDDALQALERAADEGRDGADV